MVSIFKQLFVLYLFIFLGWCFGKRKKSNAEKSDLLSFLLVNLLLPCKVFASFSKNFTVSYLKENYVAIFVSTSLLLLLVVFAKLASGKLSKNEYERRVYRYSLTISNYAYLGYSLVEALFGSERLTDMILYGIPFSCYTYTFGYALLTGGKGKIWKKLLNPITGAILLGYICGLLGVQLPDFVNTALHSASACVGPLSMLLTGLVLSSFAAKELIPDRGIVTFLAVRLLVMPLLIFGLCEGLGMLIELPEAVRASAIVMSCMPCGLNTVIFPKLVGEDCRLGARLALYSHVLSCITIPIWITVLL